MSVTINARTRRNAITGSITFPRRNLSLPSNSICPKTKHFLVTPFSLPARHLRRRTLERQRFDSQWISSEVLKCWSIRSSSVEIWFTLQVLNKDLKNMLLIGVRIDVRSNSVERSPQDFKLFGRTVEVNNEQGPRVDDLHRSISRR